MEPSREDWAAAERLKDAARAYQGAVDVWDDCLTRFLGINRTDGRCLDIVDRHGRMTAGRLAADSGLTTGAVTMVLDRLEAAGYIARERDPKDRRKVWIALTPKAVEIGHRLHAHLRGVWPKAIAHFTPAQTEAVIAFLEAGKRINLGQAALLKPHVEQKPLTPEARLAAARAFQRAAGGKMLAVIGTPDHAGAACEE